MKKLIIALLVLAALGGGAYLLYFKVLMPPQRRACIKMGRLCGGGELSGDGLARCEKVFEQVYRAGGHGRAGDAIDCILKAGSCMQGAGCMAGASLGLTGDFFQGFRQGLISK